MSKDVVIDRAVTAAPSLGYLSAWASGASIQDYVALLTGVLVLCQIIKVVLEFKDRRAAKRKESACQVSSNG